jgi:iron complex outermembrane receptor protein
MILWGGYMRWAEGPGAGRKRNVFLKSCIAMMAGVVIFCRPVSAEEVKVQLPQAEVESKFGEQDFVGPLFTETNTKIKVTRKGLQALGPSSAMSPQKSIRLMPSVNQQSVDPGGLADISNYHESFRFRGVEPTGGGNPATPVNMESVPLSGRPGGGASIFDMENAQSIAIYKGGVPSDRAFGLTNIGGKIDVQVRKPAPTFACNLKQTLGSHRFQRSFLRLDTGLLPSRTAGYLSYSHTHAEKWKGQGESGRDNAMLGLTQRIGSRVKAEAYAVYNTAEVNTYRPMRYTQAVALSANRYFDYSDKPSDYFYYDYNKNDFEDYSLMGKVEVDVGADATITLQPFYWNDSGYYLETITTGSGDNRVRKWDIDHDLSGVLTRYAYRLKSATFNLGYFFLEQQRPGPPTSWKLYQVEAVGLVFDRWQILSNSSKHRLQMPFLSGEYSMGSVTLQGGLKYLVYRMPSITTYDTTGIGDTSYEKALELATSVETNASAASREFHKLLPNFGVSWMINENLSGYFSYGRNYGMSVALYPYFISQKNSFYQKGITLQDLWDRQRLETADNFDVGLRYITDKLYFVPTLYYARHRDKAATYYDPSLGATFPTTNAEARAYGVELEVGATPLRNLSLYASASYNQFSFSQDIHARDGSVIDVKDKQVPDAPALLCSGIVSYQIGGLTFSPIVRYTSDRFGDVLHSEKIGDATIFDFNISYSGALHMLRLKKFDVSLTLDNLFDKEYISIINTSDYQTLGATYQAGAHLTVYASISVTI